MDVTPHRRPRVLVIAEAANPDMVRVPLIGWSLARALTEVADVMLVTQIRNREAILMRGLIEGQDFVAIDSEAMARRMWALGSALRRGEGRGWTIMQATAAMAYPYFEHLVWQRFRADLTAGKYDLVHRITPLSPTNPSSLSRHCARLGVPFVLGPLNGGIPWPKEFDDIRKQEGEWMSRIRPVYKLLPGRNATLRNSHAILAGSRHTASEIPARWQDKVIWLPENAVDPARFTLRANPAPGPLRACFIGRLVPLKGVDMLLEAAAPAMREGRFVLDIIGDGQVTPDLRAQVARDGTAGAVTFHGFLPHDKVQDVAARSAIMVFPSIRDFGGGVVLEAMALGLAPVIVDYAGPAELVTPDTGYAVPLGNRAAIVASLRDLIDRLERDRAGVAATGERGRQRLFADFTWSAKARQIAQVYDWVLGRATDKPVFDFGKRSGAGDVA
jgi:glycosyltransferase involved in cell wall biosynthesis